VLLFPILYASFTLELAAGLPNTGFHHNEFHQESQAGNQNFLGFHKVESPGMQMRKEPSPAPFQRENRAPEGEKLFWGFSAAKPQQKPQTPEKSR
jgi:hypothetical protein